MGQQAFSRRFTSNQDGSTAVGACGEACGRKQAGASELKFNAAQQTGPLEASPRNPPLLTLNWYVAVTTMPSLNRSKNAAHKQGEQAGRSRAGCSGTAPLVRLPGRGMHQRRLSSAQRPNALQQNDHVVQQHDHLGLLSPPMA